MGLGWPELSRTPPAGGVNYSVDSNLVSLGVSGGRGAQRRSPTGLLSQDKRRPVGELAPRRICGSGLAPIPSSLTFATPHILMVLKWGTMDCEDMGGAPCSVPLRYVWPSPAPQIQYTVDIEGFGGDSAVGKQRGLTHPSHNSNLKNRHLFRHRHLHSLKLFIYQRHMQTPARLSLGHYVVLFASCTGTCAFSARTGGAEMAWMSLTALWGDQRGLPPLVRVLFVCGLPILVLDSVSI
ncbi:hypothetical protein XENORESO_010025 [Xenotaenia resolanae]|uniref:Uncharacterized protein n=1 Tax=Xenotaenia resolanae TaxID=208358 RepID=A0ABV0WWK7_9TELE